MCRKLCQLGCCLKQTTNQDLHSPATTRTMWIITIIFFTFHVLRVKLISPLGTETEQVQHWNSKNTFLHLPRSIIYYFTTTISAVILGIILVTTVRPGSGGMTSSMKTDVQQRVVLTQDTLLDLIRWGIMDGYSKRQPNLWLNASVHILVTFSRQILCRQRLLRWVDGWWFISECSCELIVKFVFNNSTGRSWRSPTMRVVINRQMVSFKTNLLIQLYYNFSPVPLHLYDIGSEVRIYFILCCYSSF